MQIFNRKFNVAYLFGVGLIIANLSFFMGNLLGWAITLCFFLLVPGYLFLSLLKHEIISRWEIFSFSLGLSILLMMLGGLALDSLHTFGLTRPLTALNIFMMLDLITLALLLFNRHKSFTIPRFPHPDKEFVIMILVLTFLPLLAIGGAIRLNNGASNILTMILFALVAILFLVLLWRKNLQALYPYAIITMGLSVLLSTSLRGWSITGHDIQREFYVFQLTSKNSYWNISAFPNPYNACLSITILPTILQKITHISAPYIYKAVFQTIFSLGLIPIYLFMKRVSSVQIAFLASFLFISLPTFTTDIPFLNRQEIALMFFSLLMLTVFVKLSQRAKTLLVILCLLGLILSHYSSSYVALGILLLAWIFYKLFNRKPHSKKPRLISPLLSLPVIVVAFLFTFAWNFQITNTTAGLKTTLSSTLSTAFDQSSASHFGARLYQDPEQQAQQYAGSDSKNIQIINQPTLPATRLSNYISRDILPGINPATLGNIIQARAVEFIFAVTLIWVAIELIRKKTLDYFGALVLSGLVLLGIQILFPTLSVDYGTERFLQQDFIIFGIPIVIIISNLSRKLHLRNVLTFVLLLAFFLTFTGVLEQVFGNSGAQLALNNSGLYYDSYYVHKGETVSGYWLVNHLPNNAEVSVDASSLTRLTSITGDRMRTINTFVTVPSSYEYEDYLNISRNLYTLNTGQNIIYYQLNNNEVKKKDLVYANQDSRIYAPMLKH